MSPKYLRDIIPSTTRRYAPRNGNNIPLIRINNNYFINLFFPSTIAEWNKLKVFEIQIVLIYLYLSKILRITVTIP